MTMLTIGLPVFNAASTIGFALDSLLRQSFQNFKLVISDNASTDETFEIVSKYAMRDSRITCVRQIENIGAAKNFQKVSSEIATPYFMWFASDDIIEPTFLETCIDYLNSNPNIGMAFTGITNIDAMGRKIRSYPELTYLSGPASFKTIIRYINTPEVFGKANLIYSIYRTEIILQIIKQCSLSTVWGSDMSFVLCGLLKKGIYISPSVLFHKRLVKDGDEGTTPIDIVVPNSLLQQSCPLSHFDEYEKSILDAARGSRYFWLVCFLVRFRRRKLEYLQKIITIHPQASLNKDKHPFPRYFIDICHSIFFASKQLFNLGYSSGC